MKHNLLLGVAFLLTACGNPGGISDENYAKYKELGAPKILYSCNRGERVLINAKCREIEDNAKRLQCSEAEAPEKQAVIDVGYTAGIGIGATYNKILSDAKGQCDGEFKILDSKS